MGLYLGDTAVTAGLMESSGPLKKYFSNSLKDYYNLESTFEKAEIKMVFETYENLKSKLNKKKIDVIIGGDLTNQIISTNYACTKIQLPYLGIYSACATSIEAMIIAESLIKSKKIKTAVIMSSSHNKTAERQFRYPVEYGGPKHKTQTFTTTGSAMAYITTKKTKIKIESTTIGIPVDSTIKDVSNMGGVMAIAAYNTINKHLKEKKRNLKYYDLILTGDLGIYGNKILNEMYENKYNIKDSACLIFDVNKQNVFAGGSGPVCLPLVAYTYIKEEMLKGNLKKVLLVATGALMSPTTVNQKMSIPSIAHAVSLEGI